MADIQFIDGLLAKAPRSGAPDFIKASISIKRLELIAWLQGQEGEWINADIKESKGGKYYAQVGTWKPDNKREADTQDKPQRKQATPAGNFEDDEIPF